MRKRSRTKKPKTKTRKPLTRRTNRDENQSAFDAVQRVIDQFDGGSLLTPDGKDPLAVALGRRGGLKGGRARVDGMTKAELRSSASKAARARWNREREK